MAWLNTLNDAVDKFRKELNVLCNLYKNIQKYDYNTTKELARYTKSDWEQFGREKAWKRCSETRK